MAAGTRSALATLAAQEGTTPFVVALAAWQAWLGQWAGWRDVVVGTPVAQRSRPEVQHLAGLFLQTLPIRLTVSPSGDFRTLVRTVRQRVAEAFEHSSIPLSRIVAATPLQNRGQSPFPAMFALVDRPWATAHFPGMASEPVPIHTGAAKVDLLLLMTPDPGGGWRAEMEYAEDRFSRAFAEQIAGQFREFVARVALLPDAPLSGAVQTPEPVSCPSQECSSDADRDAENLCDLLEDGWEESRDRVAIEGDGIPRTYGWLRREYEALASVLASHGVGPGSAVALCLERSPELIACVLGIVRAGAAYVPMDPSYPAARIAAMLEDCAPRVMVTDRRNASQFRDLGLVVLVRETWAGAEVGPPPARCPAGREDPVYVLFTSGSTGRPKGVAMPHRALVNLIRWQRRTSVLRSGEGTLQFAPISFDVSFQEIFATLAQRGRLILVTEDERLDSHLLLAKIRARQVHRLMLPFVALQAFAEAIQGAEDAPNSLREVFTSGEALRITPAIARMFTWLPGCRFSNQYGPTEAHVVTEHVLTGEPGTWEAMPPIGRAIDGVRIRVVDESLTPVAAGGEGELLLGGGCLALGYWNRLELTAERFIMDSQAPGERWYRTGDRVMQRTDGTLEFRGRSDGQVKVRGFRVELGEIEAVLERYPGIGQAVATVRPDPSGCGRLVAHYVARGPVDPAVLRRHLAGCLPAYMVPWALVPLSHLPRTPSGKLDRTALPEPHAPESLVSAGPVLPVTAVQQRMAALWAEVLGVGIGTLGIHDNFFSRGGDSLLGMRLASRLRREFSCDLPLRQLFGGPTIVEWAALVEGVPNGSAPEMIPRTTQRGDREVPAASEQLNLWMAHHSVPNPAAFNVVVATRLRGPLDLPRLELAWRRVVERQDILGTRLRFSGGELFQEVVPPKEPMLQWVDLGVCPPPDRESALTDVLAEAARTPLDPEAAPPWRFGVVRLTDDDHALVLVIHHVLVDEWSLRALFHDLELSYQAAGGEDVVLPELSIRYADFAVWERRQLRGTDRAADHAYWERLLGAGIERLSLPMDLSSAGPSSGRSASTQVSISARTRAALEALARDDGTTPFVVLLAAWQAWLGIRTGSREVVVGTPFAQRDRSQTEPLVGLFLRTLPLKASVDGTQTFRSLVGQVRERMMEAFTHALMPLSRIAPLLRRSADTGPLFQCLFAMTDSASMGFRFPGLSAEALRVDSVALKSDLTLMVSPRADGGWNGSLEFNAAGFSPARAQAMAGELVAFLERAAVDPDAALRTLATDVVPTRGVPRDSPQGRTLPARFAEQVARFPEAEALVCGSRRWTYRELDLLSDALARDLQSAGMGSGARVGLHLQRSPEWVVAALAVLKVGAAYVPLLPGWPGPRLRDLSEGAGVGLMVSDGASAPEWLPPGIRVVDGSLRSGPLNSCSVLPPSSLTEESPAYLLFTSGSTGKPKGVLVPHRAVHRLVIGQNYVPFGSQLRCLHLSSPAFDASTFEVWAPLLNGGTCVVFPERHLDADLLEREVGSHRVNCLFLTTGLFNQIVDLRPSALKGVTDLLTGGEVLSEAHARKALEALPETRLIHCYGPTETTTFATAGLIPPVAEWSPDHPVPIGRPLPGTWCDVVDPEGQAVPDGEPGELYLGGDGVALGYGNDPQLTAARFVPDPADPSGRATRYRTGDQVRRLPDGRLVFLGRLDAQVKIRGHRIEPGEIEAVLSEHSTVRQAFVVARPAPGGVQELVACVQGHPGIAVEFEGLRRHLASRLPEYMMPAVFRALETIPLSSTGKVDRAALAAGPDLELLPAVPSVGPRTPLEILLCREWAAVLGRPEVGIHDNFFELGGQSLIALRLVGRLKQELKRPVRLADLFLHPTVAQFAETLLEVPVSSAPVRVSSAFRGRETGTPWCHVPGVYGLEFLTPVLAKLIGSHRPYFDGFQYPGLDGLREPLHSVEAIAEALVLQLEGLYPEGPLWLSGYSFGGEVAHEMARRLEAKGRAVECVVLFDSCVRGAIRRRPLPEILQVLWGRMRARPPGARIAYLRRILVGKIGDAWSRISRPLRRAALSPQERVEAASLEAHATYQPQPYGGRVCLLRATEPLPQDTGVWVRDPFNGWKPWLPPDFQVIPLTCDHESVFLDPIAPAALAAVEALLTPTPQVPKPN
jgi:surfactin family lipopeptide synthetase A